MNLLVHAVGAYIAAEAAAGRYPRPVAVGLGMLVSRLGTPTLAIALMGYALKQLNDGGAFAQSAAASRVRRRRGYRNRVGADN